MIVHPMVDVAARVNTAGTEYVMAGVGDFRAVAEQLKSGCQRGIVRHASARMLEE